MKKLRSLVVLILLTAPLAFAEGPGGMKLVRGLMAAYNAHDFDKMAVFLSDDVEWLSISGAEVAVEASGKAALGRAMAGYFENVPSARSVIERSFVSGDYVVVRERAFWKDQGEEKSQSSLAVYQIADGKIARVWYYPVEE